MWWASVPSKIIREAAAKVSARYGPSYSGASAVSPRPQSPFHSLNVAKD